ncbi:MAG: NADH-quinone oxidoreductase subunit G [Beggiatoa sp. IS2]|nr:MAG: NADH-quinone oxidoreductase subunit G [Beggiatoa sp. IS2]
MATIEIDGKPYQAELGTMLIEVADANGIEIPRFCYHKKLSVAASCRMCLVDVEKAPKPMPACATPIMEGMKVWTRSAKALMAQKAVMEFLLINHPLDCPICDQGGECELQDVAVGYGKDVSRYQEGKRVVFDKNIGPLIATEMTRCIHCTRCVRFGQEIMGIPELGATGRGEHTLIGTYIEKSVDSELSGNVIDLCPVGALTAKPSRFTARAWEIQQRDSIAPHDSVGSNVQVHVRRNRIIRVVPKDNDAINEVWLADRDRFSYQGLYAPDRLTMPMVKINGVWQETDWESALTFAVTGLKRIIETHHNAATGTKGLKQVMSAHKRLPIGALTTPTATLEEGYLLQKFMRGLGSDSIDHRLHQTDFADSDTMPLFPTLGQSIADLEKCDIVLVIGSHLRKEQPLLNHRLRKAALRGAKILLINPLDYEFNFAIAEKIIVTPTNWVTTLAGLVKALISGQSATVPEAEWLAEVTVNDSQRAMAELLTTSVTTPHSPPCKGGEGGGKRVAVLLGNLATAHPQFSVIRTLATGIAQLSGGILGYLPEAANTAGAWLAGAVPHRSALGKPVDTVGLEAHAMLTQSLKGYVLLGLEPELDSCNGAAALATLQKAEFVVSLTAYRTPTLDSYAHVLLPMALFAETSGTYINCEGKWQSFAGVVPPAGEARPAWKILRVLGNLCDLEGFNYISSEQVRDELRQKLNGQLSESSQISLLPRTLPVETVTSLQRITEMPIYAGDTLVRRAQSLQNTVDARAVAGVHINAKVAAAAHLKVGNNTRVQQGNASVILPVVIDDRVPANCVLIYGGQKENIDLGTWSGSVELSVAP